MAQMNIQVNGDTGALITLLDEDSNSCTSLFMFRITVTDSGNTVNISATGDYTSLTSDDGNYIYGTNFSASSNKIFMYMTVINSGVTSTYNSATLVFNNITTGDSDTYLVTRYNDSAIC